MNKKYIQIIFFILLASSFFYKKNNCSNLPQPHIDSPYLTTALKHIGNATYWTAQKPFQLGTNYILYPTLNTGISLAKASYEDPKVGIGLATTLAALYGIGRYSGFNQTMYNKALSAKDVILPHKSISDFKLYNDKNYSITMRMNNDEKKWFKNLPPQDNLCNPIDYKLFMWNEAIQENFIPEKSLLSYFLQKNTQWPKIISVSGDLYINGIKRKISNQTFTINNLQNNENHTADVIYESCIQPMFYQPPTKKSFLKLTTAVNYGTEYMCSIYPQNSFLHYDTFYSKKNSLEELKLNFTQWIKKYIKRDENNNPINSHSLWVLQPQVEPKWDEAEFNKKAHFNLKNQSFLCNAYHIEDVKKSIKNNYPTIQSLLAYLGQFIDDHKIMNHLYNQLLKEINCIIGIKDKIEYFKNCLPTDPGSKEGFTKYISEYNNDLTNRHQNKKLENLQTGYKYIIDSINKALTYKDNAADLIKTTIDQIKNSNFKKNIIDDLKRLSQKEPFLNIQNLINHMETINQKQINNSQTYGLHLIHEQLIQNQKIIMRIKKFINKFLLNQNDQSEPIITLLDLKNEIEKLGASINSEDLNISKKILELAGFYPKKDLHDFIKLPNEFSNFINNCNFNYDPKKIDDLYAELIFDLYIAPVFT